MTATLSRPLLLALATILGAVVGYGIRDVPAPEVISYQPAVRQSDGSLIAERLPDATPPPPPHSIPKGHTEVRRTAVTLKPTAAQCPEIKLTTSLVRDAEGGQRVIVSSPDADVLSAIDTPIVPASLPPPPRKWATGLSYDHFNHGGGVWIERDIGRLRIGADVLADSSGDFRALVRAGINF